MDRLGKNFEQHNAAASQVRLGPWSDHCDVVRSRKDVVLDEVTDNLLFGVNNMGSVICVGDNVSYAMEKKHNPMKLMW